MNGLRKAVKQIEGVYENPFACAVKEFLEKGYKDASLRESVRAAGTSTGSVYTRFGDKAGLFRAIVEPVAEEFKAMFIAVQEAFRAMDSKIQSREMGHYTLGTVTDTVSGKFKQIIVDQVDGMETTLAHLLPEMTANLPGPVCVLAYLFALDWRMALISLVSIPAGMFFMMLVMKGYGKGYEGAVKVTTDMSETIVEYINGIEGIKAFNQGKNSYAKFTGRVLENAACYYNWMKKCQFKMCLAYAIVPTTLITVLPCGWLLYQDGSLGAGTFLTCIILSLSIVGPLIAAMGFIDNLAKIGTTVAAVDEILESEEQRHAEKPAKLGAAEINVEDISFGYRKDAEILHYASLGIPAGGMTALVGPSGSGKSTLARLVAGF